MPGTITPLPVLLDEEDRKVYERLEPPRSIVLKYGAQKLIAELPYDGEAKPGCGSRLVIRTGRGIELATMLTTTCPNAGCSKSVSRKEMLDYIDNSGGKNYPFTNQGRVLRVATIEDLNEQARLDARKPDMIRHCKAAVLDLKLPMSIVDVELLLGGERIIFYYLAEQWVDFRELVRLLAQEHQTRIEMHQINDREEARLVADYERCGQYCCCKNFLKVLKPVSMRSAKVQKATLDPTKISGRCGRLMCCLRYEDETYEDLRKRLPHRKTVVETEDGVGEVQDTQILTQLVLVWVPGKGRGAYPLENIRLLNKDETKAWRQQQKEAEAAAAERAMRYGAKRDRVAGAQDSKPPNAREQEGTRPVPREQPRRPRPGQPLQDAEVESKEGLVPTDVPEGAGLEPISDESAGPQEAGDESVPPGATTPAAGRGYSNAKMPPSTTAGKEGGGSSSKKRRRRRRRRGRGKGQPGGDAGG